MKLKPEDGRTTRLKESYHKRIYDEALEQLKTRKPTRTEQLEASTSNPRTPSPEPTFVVEPHEKNKHYTTPQKTAVRKDLIGRRKGCSTSLGTIFFDEIIFKIE